jgi:hypothetical protein
MANRFAGTVYPVPTRFVGWGKEAAGTSGVPVQPTTTMPLKTLTPVDKITYLEDDAWRGAQAGLYNMIQGVEISDVSLGGPFFADTTPFALAGVLGDYYQSVNTGAVGTATTLNGGVSVGATAITLTSATGFTNTTVFAVGALGSKQEEIRQANSLSGSVLYFTTPLYQSHLTAAAVTPYSTVNLTINHNFALLNSGAGMGGFSVAQPPTYTITDNTGVPASTGARLYSYAVPTEVSLTGTSTGLVDWEGKYITLASVIAGTAPTNTLSTVAPQPSWNSTVTIGGSPEYNNIEYKFSLMRKAEPVFGNNSQQAPFAIPRGWFTAGLNLNFDPAVDESEYLFYMNNTQPTVVVTSTNGLAGTSAATITYTAQVAAFDTGQINDSKEAFGYDLTAKLVANTTNVGPSGGFGPIVVTVQNAVISY